MQESLYDTVQKLKSSQKINVEQLESILDTDIEEVVALCKKACLKPKTDSLGNAYFTVEDVDILKKMKELYSQAQTTQKQAEISSSPKIEEAKRSEDTDLTSPNKKVNFLTKAKDRLRSQAPVVSSVAYDSPMLIEGSLKKLEENLIDKFSAVLSEKMDGFDEIIVELIRAKTENENLRNQVNDLNKQVFILKKELASFSPLPFGFFTKKEDDEL